MKKGKKMLELSIAIIAKNESEMIAGCLESVKDADEIVVVDTGSEDNTVDIAKSYTDKVFTDYKWEDNFANARNHAIKKCKGHWILSIDADDRLEKDGIKKIRETIRKYPSQDCFNVLFKAKQSPNTTHVLPYLYQNNPDTIFFSGAAHNYLSVPAHKHAGVSIIYGHSPAHKKDPDRTLRILEKEVKKNPDKPRELFYLAREYQYRKRWQDAIDMIQRYLKVSYWDPEIADAYLRLSKCYCALHQMQNAKRACMNAISINPNFKEAILYMASICEYKNSANWIFMAEVARNTNVLFVRNKTEKPLSYFEKEKKKEPDKAYLKIEEAISKAIGNRPMLDIGFGLNNLKQYIPQYRTFENIKSPYDQAKIYSKILQDYNVYVFLNVLQYLERDKYMLECVPRKKQVLIAVPSYDSSSHVRRYTEDMMRFRYKDIIQIYEIVPFFWASIIWDVDTRPTKDYILLCAGVRI